MRRAGLARLGLALGAVLVCAAVLVTMCQADVAVGPGSPGVAVEPAPVGRETRGSGVDEPARRHVDASSRAVATSEPAPPDLHDAVHVRFLVTDRLDRPVEGARIELGPMAGARVERVVLTDAAGRAEADAERGWECLVRAEGFADHFVRDWSTPEVVRVVLEPGFPVAGVVVGPDGEPVPEAWVSLCLPDLPDQIVVTGADGAFRYEAVPAGDEVYVTVRSPVGSARLVAIPPGTMDARIEVGPEAPTRGPRPPPGPAESFVVVMVSTVDGSPVPDAGLAVYPDNVNPSGLVVTTDARGIASIRVSYRPGQWVSVRVTEPEVVQRPRTFNVRAETRAAADGVPTRFVVPDVTPVRIVVLGDSGPLTAADGATVRFQFGERPWADLIEAFLVDDAPDAPRHWLNVIAPGYVRHSEQVTIVRGRVNELRVRLVRAASLRGSLFPDFDDTYVDVFTPGEEEPFHHQVLGPDEDGFWAVDHVPPGDVDVLVIRRGVPVWHRRLSVSSGDDVDLGEISLPLPRVVSGVVTDADGQPLSGCEITGTVVGRAAEIPPTATDATGRFTVLLGAVPGVVLRIDRRGFGTEHVAIAAKQAESPIAVTLRPGGSVALTYRRDRSSSTSWWVETVDGLGRWQPEEGPPVGDAPAVPEGYGGHVFIDLPVGPLVVVVARDTVERRRVDVRAGETIEVSFD